MATQVGTRSRPRLTETRSWICYSPGFELMRKQLSRIGNGTRGFVFLLTVFLIGPWLAAEDVSVTGKVDRGQCSTWSWAEQEKIPIFDPLPSPDAETSQQQIQALDQRIRRTVEELLEKRGWRKTPSGECRLSYSLIQELDLDVARYDTGGMVPGNVGDAGSGMGAAKADSYLRKKGTFTLDITGVDSPLRLWRGTLANSLGQGKDAENKSLKLVKEVVKVVPKQ